MSNNKRFMAAACMVTGMLAVQPAMAISELGGHMQAKGIDAASSGNAGEHYMAEPSSLHHFLPELIGSPLYLRLLQSDAFITLNGLAESMWEKYTQ